MRNLQFLIFEVGRDCNLAAAHTKCPSADPERWAHVDTSQAISDETIVQVAVAAYREHGFIGLIGFHYYNEPLLEKDRVMRLVAAIRAEVPESRFVLWTNGTQMPPDLNELQAFHKLVISNYQKRDWSRVKNLVPSVTILSGELDQRHTMPDTGHDGRPCLRPYLEMIFDYYGNVRLCCMDWRGLASPGNIHTKSLAELVAAFQGIRRAVAGTTFLGTAPPVCKACALRQGGWPGFVPEAEARAKLHRRELTAPVTYPVHGKSRAVVSVHYKLPEQRLRDHFRWNEEFYRQHGIQVYVVTDREYEVPSYAHCLVFPEHMPVFNLSRCSNFGIQHAVAQGHEIIVKTDADICLPAFVWDHLLAVDDHVACVPLYIMSSSYAARDYAYVEAPRAEGTVAMTAANWQRIQYDERCEGYGADDGILIAKINRARLTIDRAPFVFHIAHIEGTPQKEGGGRMDHWNRTSGFNPNNNNRNRAFFQDLDGTATLDQLGGPVTKRSRLRRRHQLPPNRITARPGNAQLPAIRLRELTDAAQRRYQRRHRS